MSVQSGPMKLKTSTRRFGVLSAGLTLLCLGAVLYQVRVCAFGFERLFHSQDVSAMPFLMSSASATMDAVYGTSSAAGIRPGDVLISVNNVPYTGTDVVSQAVAHSHPGAVLDVLVRSATSGAEKHVRVPLQMRGAQLTPSAFRTLQVSVLIRYFITPLVCLLLGFWVILQRPRNPLAWLLWVLLLGLSNFMLD